MGQEVRSFSRSIRYLDSSQALFYINEDRFRVVQEFFAPIDSRLEDHNVEMSVESPSLVGTIVGNSSDAVINGRPMKKRLLLAGRSKMLRCDSVINQSADILFSLIVRKGFSFYFPRHT